MKKCILFIVVSLSFFALTSWSADTPDFEVPTTDGGGLPGDTTSFSEGYKEGYELGYSDASADMPWRVFTCQVSARMYVCNYRRGYVAGYRAGRETLEGPTMVTNATRTTGDTIMYPSTSKSPEEAEDEISSEGEVAVGGVADEEKSDKGKTVLGKASTVTKTSAHQAGAQQGASDAANGVGYLQGVFNASKEWLDGYHEAYFKTLGGFLPPAGL